MPLLERMDGVRFVAGAEADLPYLFILNGRQDGSIPWENNPPFYRTLDATGQGFAAYWDNGIHSTSGKDAPADVKDWTKALRRFRLNESFPAFSATSSNCNPGHGDPAEGDLIGWMNRGMDWTEIEDEADHYAVTLRADFPGIAYPITTDVTLRRVQRFKPKPGEALRVRRDAEVIPITTDANGRITIPRVVIPDARGVRVAIRRS